MFSSDTTQVSDGGYQISRSLRFNSADSANLSRTPASAGNQQIWTINTWVKRSKLGTLQTLLRVSGVPFVLIDFTADDKFSVDIYNGSVEYILKTTQVFRDVSAWGMMTIAVDTTQATASNRVKIYWNGVQITEFVTSDYPPQNNNTALNSTAITYIGGNVPSSNQFTDFYLTEFNLIDGQQLTPSSFGQTDAQTGVWGPKAYAGSYGTNGFYLNFSDNSNTTAATLGKDYSGNGNNFTPNNFSVTAGLGNDSLVDSPTNYGVDTGAGGEVRGNYCTFNPLDKASDVTVVNGNLDVTWSDVNGHSIRSTIAMKSGKWYTEVTVGGNSSIGIATQSFNMTSWVGSDANSWGYAPNGQKVTASSYSSFGTALSNGNIVGIAFDADSGKLWFSLNGTWQASGSPSTGANPAFTVTTAIDYFLAIGYWTSPNTNVNSFNTGQRPFAYTAPSGFQALCTQNLPTPTIGATTATQAGKFFNPVLYTGNGGTNNITGVGFQPDWVWIKSRNDAYNHQAYDAVRGTNKRLFPSTTGEEFTDTDSLMSFNSDGFTSGAEAGMNASAITYVAWNWKANGSGSTNTAGTITSTVSANTTSGFSIVTYTGTGANATVGHGLGAVPSMIIVKCRNASGDIWDVYHVSIGNTQYLRLNGTNGAATFNSWQNTTPTSTVFYISTDTVVNTNGNTYVAYCFAPIAGYSAFGSYTGNNSADGPFVYLGFKPKFVLIKDTGTIGNWWIGDGTRSTYNVVSESLLPNLSNAESSAYNECDFLSNGFKWRANDANSFPNNVSGNTYIYMAFASNPFKYSLAR